MTMTKDVRDTLRTLFDDVTTDVDVYQLDRAYQTSAVMLTVGTRLGWPAADVFLEFTLAVRALLRDNLDPSARLRSREQYVTAQAAVGAALDAS